MEENEFSQWLFESRLRQGKKCCQMGWIGCAIFAGNSKSHRETSISFILFESPHQVDMKKVVKSSKHFLGYFNTLETHNELVWTWMNLSDFYFIFMLIFRWNHTPLSEAVDHQHPHIEQYLKRFMREKTYLDKGGNPYQVAYDRGVTTI